MPYLLKRVHVSLIVRVGHKRAPRRIKSFVRGKGLKSSKEKKTTKHSSSLRGLLGVDELDVDAAADVDGDVVLGDRGLGRDFNRRLAHVHLVP